MKDRRKEPRIRGRHEVTVTLYNPPGPGGSGDGAMTCETHDISLTDLRLVAAQPLAVGEVVELSVTVASLPGEFLHWGRICWCRAEEDGQRYAMGVSFTRSSAATRELWRKYLEDVLAAVVA